MVNGREFKTVLLGARNFMYVIKKQWKVQKPRWLLKVVEHWKKEGDMLTEKKKMNYKLPASKKIFSNPNIISCIPEVLPFLLTEENTIL